MPTEEKMDEIIRHLTDRVKVYNRGWCAGFLAGVALSVAVAFVWKFVRG